MKVEYDGSQIKIESGEECVSLDRLDAKALSLLLGGTGGWTPVTANPVWMESSFANRCSEFSFTNYKRERFLGPRVTEVEIWGKKYKLSEEEARELRQKLERALA